MKKSIAAFSIVFLVCALFSPLSFGDDGLTELEKLEIEKMIRLFIRDAYVDTSLKMTTVIDGAIQGMIDKLDPHSSYMPKETAEDFREKIRGNFEGIGITFAMIEGKITVIQVIDGGPSQKAGLRSRDKIVKIDGDDVVGISQDIVKNRLRGPAGSKVTVHVERPGEPELLEFTITRDRVNISSVSQAFMLDEETGYIKLNKFTLHTHHEVNAALKKLREKGMKKLVLDLRGNSGGSLDAAVNVVDNFIKKKGELIVETRGKRNSDNRVFVTRGDAEYADIPMIVMINHASASASEIVAGALQDHDRALIVGQTSFGKGLVMNTFRLIGGRKRNLGTLVLSVAHYYTPSGRLIQRPYDNGKEEYIKEGFDDFDPNAVDSTRAGKPVYYTDLGRKVYGGGGITPDRMLDPLRRLNKLEQALRNSNLFFEFADGYLVRHDDVPGDFDEYLAYYEIPEDEIERFRTFITEKGIKIDNAESFRNELEKILRKYDLSDETLDVLMKSLEESGIDLNVTLFDKSVDFIKREIKGEIARMVWGDEERFKVWQTDDTELSKAVSYFDEAQELLERRIAMLKKSESGGGDD